jgi:transposase
MSGVPSWRRIVYCRDRADVVPQQRGRAQEINDQIRTFELLPFVWRAFESGLILCRPRKEAIVAASKTYPDELRERAVRLYRESDPKPVVRRLAEQLNVHPEALRNWIRQDKADRGQRHDRPTTDMVAKNRRNMRENAELTRVNDLLRAANTYFAGEIDPTRRRS